MVCVAAWIAAVSAIPPVLREHIKHDDLKPISRSMVGSDFNGAVYKVMTQYRQGTTTGMAPECPKSMKFVEGDVLLSVDGILKIPYDQMKLWGSSEDEGTEPNSTCKATGHGHIELSESQLLRGGENLDELRESFDISSVFDDVTDEDVAAGAVTDEVQRLHQSVWTALKGKQYFTGKMDYAFGDESPQKEMLGIKCERAENWFTRGELLLFVDEQKDVEIRVKTSAKSTEGIVLKGNRRYAVVTTADSTCIYHVVDDIKAERNSDLDKDGNNEVADQTIVKPPVMCKAGCTCSCA